jgi:hypothetical protein
MASVNLCLLDLNVIVGGRGRENLGNTGRSTRDRTVQPGTPLRNCAASSGARVGAYQARGNETGVINPPITDLWDRNLFITLGGNTA